MSSEPKRYPHPRATLNFPKTKIFIIFTVQESFSSDTDAAAGAAAGAAATAAASRAAFVFTTVFEVVATVAAAEAAAVAAAPAAAPAAASVSEEKDSRTLNMINVLVFGKLSFSPCGSDQHYLGCWGRPRSLWPDLTQMIC